MKNIFRLTFITALIFLAFPLQAQDFLSAAKIENAVMKKAEIYFRWMQTNPPPIPLHIEGLPNAYQITPLLYRGGQPTPEGYRALAKRGVKVVVSLRVQSPDEELIKKAGLVSYHIPINPFLFNNTHARKFFNILENAPGPVYVHCLHGSDRTGTMIALYRLLYNHWNRDRALRELKSARFGFHPVFANLPAYIQHVRLTDLQTHPLVYTPQAIPVSAMPNSL